MPNNISPMSYTNKDFKSIYEELLNLAKDLSYKWDPTISNESDPGVVLLKLNAIIGDKNNYNIDKNILEAFPETVTQQVAARQLFNQLGYKMPWYRAATTDIVVKWIGRELVTGEVVTIPRYTMITNDESDTVYTLISDVQITNTTKQSTVTVPALQGKIVHYSIAGTNNITSNNFDKLNRLYLNDYNIAENGIFVSNISDASIEWVQVDNIQLYPVGSYVYEFNVDARTNTCYLEFPEDFDALIGSGLNISYITTQGSTGNVQSRNLTTFLNDISITLSGEEITLNGECIEMYNNKSATDGTDPEDIDGAYRSYKRVVGTFDTLVTLRDYISAAINSGYVSNGVVSDRLNDIQTTYSVVTTTLDSLNTEIMQEKLDTDGEVKYVKVWPGDKIPVWNSETYYEYSKTNSTMSLISTDFTNAINNNTRTAPIYVLESTETTDLTAYDLRMYLLHNVNQIASLDDYNKSYEVVSANDSTMTKVKSHLENLKCVQHDFKDILKDRYCMFKTVYPLNMKIVPQYKLNDTQINILKNNIFEALRELLQSKNVDFGSEPDYDEIYNTISTADNRIKFIMLDDFKFTTYAVYWDGTQFKEIPISEFNADNTIYKSNKAQLQEVYNSDTNKYKNCYFITTEPEVTEDGIIKSYTCYIPVGNSLQVYSDKIKEFRTEIIAKSVLAGVTSLFNIDNRFNYTLSKTPYIPDSGTGGSGELPEGVEVTKTSVHNDVTSVSTKLIICPFNDNTSTDNVDSSGVVPGQIVDSTENSGSGGSGDTDTTISITPTSTTEKLSSSYTLGPNESLRFFGPSFKTETSYSNYVKFLLVLNNQTGFEYSIVDLTNDLPISIYNPVYLYQFDTNSGKYIYREYTIDGLVTDSSGNTGTITELSAAGTLQVFRRIPSYIIPAEHDYKLREDDMLILFWREQQEDDSPYTFKVYRGIDENQEKRDKNGKLLKSPIINATFTIVGTDKDTCPVSLQDLNIVGNSPIDSGTIKHSVAINSAYYKVSKLYGDNDLSGSKTIDIKVENEAELRKEDSQAPYYYFVTHKIVTEKDSDGKDVGKYVMSLKDDANGKFYILEEDEYFIQINSNKTAYEIYGPGTMIRINNYVNSSGELVVVDVSELKVNKVTYEDILENGISVIEDHCVAVNDYSITVCEQQMYVLTTGDTVYMTLSENYFNSDGKTVTMIPPTDGVFNIRLEDTVLDSTIRVTGDKDTSDIKYTIQSVTTSDTAQYLLPQCTITQIIQCTTTTKPEVVNDEDVENTLFKYCHINKYKVKVFPQNPTAIYVTYKTSNDVHKQYEIYNANKYNEVLNNTFYKLYNKNNTEPQQDDNISFGTYDEQTGKFNASGYGDWYINTSEQFRVFNTNTYYSHTTIGGKSTYTLLEEAIDREVYILTFDLIPCIAKNTEWSDTYTNTVFQIDSCKAINNNENYTLTYQYAESTRTPMFESDSYTDVSNINITFTTSGDEKTVKTLPVTNVGSNKGNWRATARLDIVSNNTKAQELCSVNDQSAQVYYVSKETGEGTKYIIYYVEDSGKHLYIGSNVDISKVGGSDVDVTYLDLLGNRHGVDLFVYTDNAFNNSNISTTEVGNINIDMSTVAEYELTTSFEPGYKYILPIQNRSTNGKFKISGIDSNLNPEKGDINGDNIFDNEDLALLLQHLNGWNADAPIVDINIGDLTGDGKVDAKDYATLVRIVNQYTLHDSTIEHSNGMYYFIVDSATESISIKITTPDNAQLTLLPLIKYKDEDIFNNRYGIAVSEIIRKMKSLDKDLKFRYDYVIPEDKLIVDPLNSASFFNSNHIYNNYNISKCNLDTTRTFDGTRALPNNSEVIIVSNR